MNQLNPTSHGLEERLGFALGSQQPHNPSPWQESLTPLDKDSYSQLVNSSDLGGDTTVVNNVPAEFLENRQHQIKIFRAPLLYNHTDFPRFSKPELTGTFPNFSNVLNQSSRSKIYSLILIPFD